MMLFSATHLAYDYDYVIENLKRAPFLYKRVR
jgi:hypothetical protein